MYTFKVHNHKLIRNTRTFHKVRLNLESYLDILLLSPKTELSVFNISAFCSSERPKLCLCMCVNGRNVKHNIPLCVGLCKWSYQGLNRRYAHRESGVMSRSKVIYQTVCSLEVSHVVRLTEGNVKLKHTLKTVLNRSGCGAMEAEGGILIVGSKN